MLKKELEEATGEFRSGNGLSAGDGGSAWAAILFVNGVECVALAHGLDADPVVRHPFFGTERVVGALSRLPGWEEGLVQLQPGSLLRDLQTGLVCGFAIGAEEKGMDGKEEMTEKKIVAGGDLELHVPMGSWRLWS